MILEEWNDPPPDRLKTDIACPPVQTVKDQPVQYPDWFLFQASYSSSGETWIGWGGGTGAYVEPAVHDTNGTPSDSSVIQSFWL